MYNNYILHRESKEITKKILTLISIQPRYVEANWLVHMSIEYYSQKIWRFITRIQRNTQNQLECVNYTNLELRPSIISAQDNPWNMGVIFPTFQRFQVPSNPSHNKGRASEEWKKIYSITEGDLSELLINNSLLRSAWLSILKLHIILTIHFVFTQFGFSFNFIHSSRAAAMVSNYFRLVNK